MNTGALNGGVVTETHVNIGETGTTAAVPHPVTDPARIPSARYTSSAFLEAERERLWPRVWQVACQVEELPQPGAFTEYTIADQSILVVRTTDDEVRAYYNACRHRGSTLGAGAGDFAGGQISCPFHGWRWDLEGSNTYVHHREGFRPGCVEEDDLRLRSVRAEVAHGMVWITMQPDAPPVRQWLGAFDATLDATGLENMRVTWWHTRVLPANWKVAIEAFLEAYHVMATHPEFSMGAIDDDAPVPSTYRTTPEGHGWNDVAVGRRNEKDQGLPEGGPTPAEFMANMHRVMRHGARGQVTERQLEIQEELLTSGVTDREFIKAFFTTVYSEAAEAGVPLKAPSPEQTSHGYVFPNVSFVQELGNALMFRARPNGDDPHSCIFDFWGLETPPSGAPVARPTPDAPIDDLWFLQQDIRNITRQQAGLRTRGHTESRLSLDYEPMIANMHRALDEVMARP